VSNVSLCVPRVSHDSFYAHNTCRASQPKAEETAPNAVPKVSARLSCMHATLGPPVVVHMTPEVQETAVAQSSVDKLRYARSWTCLVCV